MSVSEPLVSVVVPVYNGDRFLAEAIEAVLAQTFRAWELIIVDDGSTDGTREIVQDFCTRYPSRIRCLSHPERENRGISASRNLGIGAARGELIAHLDSDDVWIPSKLERQVELLAAMPEAAMVFGRPLYWSSWAPGVDSSQDSLPPVALPAGEVIHPPRGILEAYPLGPGGAPCPSDILVRRRLVEEIGGFEAAFVGPYQLYEDQAFLTKVYLAAPVLASEESWTRYRLHRDSCMAQVKREGMQDEARRFFLYWLRSHLRETGVRDPRIWRALNRALWPYEHPRLHALRSAAAHPRRTLLRLIRRLVPRPYRTRLLRVLKRAGLGK